MNCDFCGKEIPDDVIAHRHYTDEELRTRKIVCNHACDIARRRRDGQFKAMSQVGKDARSKAVATSNREKPRRKKA